MTILISPGIFLSLKNKQKVKLAVEGIHQPCLSFKGDYAEVKYPGNMDIVIPGDTFISNRYPNKLEELTIPPNTIGIIYFENNLPKSISIVRDDSKLARKALKIVI